MTTRVPKEKGSALSLVNGFLQSDYHRMESLSDCVFHAQVLHFLSHWINDYHNKHGNHDGGDPVRIVPVFPLQRVDFAPKSQGARAANAAVVSSYLSRVNSGNFGAKKGHKIARISAEFTTVFRRIEDEVGDVFSRGTELERFGPAMRAYASFATALVKEDFSSYDAAAERTRAEERRQGKRNVPTTRWVHNPNLTPLSCDADNAVVHATEWSQISRPTLSAPAPAQDPSRGAKLTENTENRAADRELCEPEGMLGMPFEDTHLVGDQRRAELLSLSASLAAEVEADLSSVFRAREAAEGLSEERDFYYMKLRRIEEIVLRSGDSDQVRRIWEVITRETSAFQSPPQG